jgi:hypothetical protein
MPQMAQFDDMKIWGHFSCFHLYYTLQETDCNQPERGFVMRKKTACQAVFLRICCKQPTIKVVAYSEI